MAKYSLKIIHGQELKNKVCVIVGTRPGIIMFSPIIRELERRKISFFVVHTGQHYSYNMDKVLFEDLKLKRPKYRLNSVKRCKLHGEQTAEMLKGCEAAMLKEKPKIVLVGGDANTNLSAALAARKLHISVGHIEAGERSFDWRMPEEHNRRIIDNISDYLFATGLQAKRNLLREHVMGKIFITGNTIVDAAYQNLDLALKSGYRLSAAKRRYCLVTVHREENVDYKENLYSILKGLIKASRVIGMPMMVLAHPRTLNRIKQFGFMPMLRQSKELCLESGTGYLNFLSLLKGASLVFTDSGGVQQEACILGVPCVTLRENTEWVETITLGCNILAGSSPDRILNAANKMLRLKKKWRNPFGDGHAARKIIDIVERKLGQ